MNIYSDVNFKNIKGKNTLRLESNQITPSFLNLYGNNELNNFVLNSNLENNSYIK